MGGARLMGKDGIGGSQQAAVGIGEAVHLRRKGCCYQQSLDWVPRWLPTFLKVWVWGGERLEQLLGLLDSLPQRFMELEDAQEQERKAHVLSVTRLEGQSRALDGKARSYADQGEVLCV